MARPLLFCHRSQVDELTSALCADRSSASLSTQRTPPVPPSPSTPPQQPIQNLSIYSPKSNSEHSRKSGSRRRKPLSRSPAGSPSLAFAVFKSVRSPYRI